MYSLNFYAEYDAHHTIFRYHALCERFPVMRVEVYRIVDYFFLNPFDLNTFRVSGGAHRQIAKDFSDLKPYRRVSEPAGLAIYMWQFQQTALAALARRHVISASALGNDVIQWTGQKPESSEFKALVEAERERKESVLAFLSDALDRYQLSGPGGIKDRSGLLDYRYDVKNVAAA